jgi:hypothetical protein
MAGDPGGRAGPPCGGSRGVVPRGELSVAQPDMRVTWRILLVASRAATL